MASRRWTAALVGGALWAVALPAVAQSVTVSAQSLERKLGFRKSDQEPTWLSYSDCTGNDELSFETTLVSAVGLSLEVWVGSGSDCNPYEARQGSSPTCWQVYKTNPQATTQKVKIRAQDIIAQNKTTDGTWGPGTGTAADCDVSGAASEGQQITLYFILVDGTGQPKGTGSNYPTKFDVVGPPAPEGVSAGVGENLLVVSWDASTALDLIGYRVYCDPKAGATAPANGPMADAGAAGSGGAAGASTDAATDGSSDASSDAGSDAASDAAAAGTGGTGGSDGGSAGNASCPSAALTPGLRPDSAYQCGSVTGKLETSANAGDLTNGVNYAVAVAGVDRVGNSGPLSSVACGSPQPVDDFFELYRRAGGKGGGGFCAIGADPSRAGLAALGVALLAFALRRRRS